MDASNKSWYVAFMMETTELRVVIANESHLNTLTELIGTIEAEDHPDALVTADNASEGMRQSLNHFDALNSDCVWFLIAFYRDQPAGLAIITRVPKLDDRLGFLYLDELHVIGEYRRRGVGKALISRCIELAQERGLGGIRLLARIGNEPARSLYESVGFQGNETMLYQFRFDHSESQQ